MDTRKCTRCHKVLPITNFYKQKTGVGGYSNYCGQCIKRIKKLKDGTLVLSKQQIKKKVLKLNSVSKMFDNMCDMSRAYIKKHPVKRFDNEWAGMGVQQFYVRRLKVYRQDPAWNLIHKKINDLELVGRSLRKELNIYMNDPCYTSSKTIMICGRKRGNCILGSTEIVKENELPCIFSSVYPPNKDDE